MKLLAPQMHYSRKSARVLVVQEFPNTTIRSKMQAEQSIIDRIKTR